MQGGVFVRTHDGDRLLNPYEVHVLVSGQGQPRDDEEIVMEASPDDLDLALVETLLARMRSTRASDVC